MTDLRDRLQRTLGDACTIDREIGGGGMSRVFVATENTLGRSVVVKTLPSDSASSVSVERFKREIQVAAKLQHPHIVPILSTGETDGIPFYTMPFVKGDSLRERLAKSGELSVNDTIHILRDVASALAHAHAEGVVHRDIKPENVMLSGGVAVVTDFGVAKAIDLAVTDGGGHATALTSLGIALGTPAYMAPEQASAEPTVDHRADIYSFGCIAYEMLTGSSPFAGRPLQQLLAAHVTEAPAPVLTRRATTPPALAALVMRCLEKRPGDRPQSADELITSLDAIGTPSGGTMPTGARLAPVRTARTRWMIGGGVAIALGIAAFLAWSKATAVRPLTVDRTIRIAFGPELEVEPAISPDGKLIAYGAASPAGMKLFVRQVDGGRATAISGDLTLYLRQPAPNWSPDGTRISFRANGAIYVVQALGGEPKRLIETRETASGQQQAAGTHSWSPDGSELAYGLGNSIWLRGVDGGEPRSIVTGASPHSPAWSPDGRLIAYADGLRPAMNYVATNAVWIVSASGGTPVRVSDSTHVNISPVWAPDSKSILFISDAGGARDVYQLAVGANGRSRGAPVRVTTGLGAYRISLSADGSRLAHDIVRNNTDIWSVSFGAGAPVPISAGQPFTRESQHVEAMDVSHDGKWIVYDSDRGGNFDIYKMRVEGGEPIQLTTSTANDFAPRWSPDDRQVVFQSSRDGSRDIYIVSAEGGAEQRVTSSPRREWYASWWPDGSRILFSSDSGGHDERIDVATLTNGTWSVQPQTIDPAMSGRTKQVYPFGSLVAYVRSESTLAVIPVAGGDARVIASARQLGGPLIEIGGWSRDGQTVFVRAGRAGSEFWAVPVASGAPRVVVSIDPGYPLGTTDWSTDGTRLFFVRGAAESDVNVMEMKAGR